MLESYQRYEKTAEPASTGQRQDSNEVVIIIRDGKVVTFIQKNRNTSVEGMYGDGI